MPKPPRKKEYLQAYALDAQMERGQKEQTSVRVEVGEERKCEYFCEMLRISIQNFILKKDEEKITLIFPKLASSEKYEMPRLSGTTSQFGCIC